MVTPSQYFLRIGAVLLVSSIAAVQSFTFSNPAQSRVHQLYPKAINTELNAAPTKSSPGNAEPSKSNVRPRRKKKRKPSRKHLKELKNPNELETWRVYGLDVSPDSLGEAHTADKRKQKENDLIPPERAYLTPPVLSSLLSRLRIKSDNNNLMEREVNEILNNESLPPQLKDVSVVRRSLDARRRRGSDPKFTYVLDVTLTKQAGRDLHFLHQPGRIERMSDKKTKDATSATGSEEVGSSSKSKPKIIIVGAGPAGLFCALSLASSGLFTPILLERGQPVEARGKSIGALIHRREIDPESNFSFGEGGAGTWSDGKLTTRIGRNSGPVRFVLETLVKYGAPKRILVEGAPHLGTDNLVRLLRNMRQDLRSMGGEIHFGACANKFHIENGSIKGVDAKCTKSNERMKPNSDRPEDNMSHQDDPKKSFLGDAVVLATGHSARDVYYELHEAGVELEAKGFAVGFRIEHPQKIINEIQYGKDWGGRVFTQRRSTDTANKEHFSKDVDESITHKGTLPVAAYRLATNEAFDGESNRGAYSFCQCPGGQIVPSSTEVGELCINGMSFSNRDSLWANSALVVTVSPDDPILEPYRSSHGCLAGLEFQRDMERKAYELGGGGMRAPVQRLPDYMKQRISESVPSSSYRIGVQSAPLHDIYPEPLYNALTDAIIKHFDKQMPGFVCDDALLHGVETRTSSPVRVLRDSNSLEALGIDNLFPSGEGAGFAGGIVSAAVDGLLVADAIKAKFAAHDKSSIFNDSNQASVGFDY